MVVRGNFTLGRSMETSSCASVVAFDEPGPAEFLPYSASAAWPDRTTLFPGTSLGDVQRTPVEISPVESLDGLLSLCRSRHRYESETTRLARAAILYERSFDYRACFCEEVFQLDFGGFEGKIPYVEPVVHDRGVMRQRSICACFRSSDFKSPLEVPREVNRVTSN